jgi:hypothetical protein
MADMVMERLKKAGHPFPDCHLTYRGVGHFIPLPNMPTPAPLALGGDAENTAAAAIDSWAHTIKFLNSSVGR